LGPHENATLTGIEIVPQENEFARNLLEAALVQA